MTNPFDNTGYTPLKQTTSESNPFDATEYTPLNIQTNLDIYQPSQPISQVQPVSQQEVLDKQDELTNEKLLSNARWIKAAKQIYKNDEGKEFKGPDSAVAKWLLNRRAAFEYDLTNTIKTAARADSFDDVTKKAWSDAIDLYDELPMSWRGTGRAVRHMLTDPTFVASLGLGLGAGAIAKQLGSKGVTAAAKLSFKEALKKYKQELQQVQLKML